MDPEEKLVEPLERAVKAEQQSGIETFVRALLIVGLLGIGVAGIVCAVSAADYPRNWTGVGICLLASAYSIGLVLRQMR